MLMRGGHFPHCDCSPNGHGQQIVLVRIEQKIRHKCLDDHVRWMSRAQEKRMHPNHFTKDAHHILLPHAVNPVWFAPPQDCGSVYNENEKQTKKQRPNMIHQQLINTTSCLAHKVRTVKHTCSQKKQSPALDPLRWVLEHVLRTKICGPWRADDNVHVQQGTTHASAFNQYLEKGGYFFIASAETGGSLKFYRLFQSSQCNLGKSCTMGNHGAPEGESSKECQILICLADITCSLANKHLHAATSGGVCKMVGLWRIMHLLVWCRDSLLSFGSTGEPGDHRLTEFSRCVARCFAVSGKFFTTTVSLLGPSRVLGWFGCTAKHAVGNNYSIVVSRNWSSKRSWPCVFDQNTHTWCLNCGS